MSNGENDPTIHQNPAGGLIQAIADSSPTQEDSDWSEPLWDAGWEGQSGVFGPTQLCVAAKKWADGTVDVLVAHDPYAEDGNSIAYAHRHRVDATPVTVHGLANDVVSTVLSDWGPPQQGKQVPEGS